MENNEALRIAYRLQFRGDSSDSGLMNWSPLRQLNSWFRSQDSYLLRASIMAFGWRQFLISGNRPHFFESIEDAAQAVDLLISEASLLAIYSTSPALSMADLFLASVQGSYDVLEAVRQEVLSAVEISEVRLTQHDVQLAMVLDRSSSAAWYVVNHFKDEGHLYLGGDIDSPTWLTEAELYNAWSSHDELEALHVAKTLTRREGYYTYPLRLTKAV